MLLWLRGVVWVVCAAAVRASRHVVGLLPLCPRMVEVKLWLRQCSAWQLHVHSIMCTMAHTYCLRGVGCRRTFRACW